jgi:hypothetical protein
MVEAVWQADSGFILGDGYFWSPILSRVSELHSGRSDPPCSQGCEEMVLFGTSCFVLANQAVFFVSC